MSNINDFLYQIGFGRAGGFTNKRDAVDKLRDILNTVDTSVNQYSAIRKLAVQTALEEAQKQKLQQEEAPISQSFGVPSVDKEQAMQDLFNKQTTDRDSAIKNLFFPLSALPPEEVSTLTPEELKDKGYDMANIPPAPVPPELKRKAFQEKYGVSPDMPAGQFPAAQHAMLLNAMIPKTEAQTQKISQPSSKLLTPEEEAQRIRINQAYGASRAEGFGNIRPITVFDTEDGSVKTMNMNEFNKINQEHPDRFVSEQSASGIRQKQMIMNDIKGSLALTKQSLAALPRDFTTVENAQFAKVLQDADPRSAFQSFIQGQIGGTLNTEQIDYMTDIIQLREQMLAMRNILGAGQGSDMLRSAILATIPSGSTPSREYATAQLEKATKTINRLESFVPTMGKEKKIPINPAKNPQNQEQFKIGDVKTNQAGQKAAYIGNGKWKLIPQ